MSRARLLEDVRIAGKSGDISDGLGLIAQYASACNYLLVRWDIYSEGSLDFAVSSNWPYDLVRKLGVILVRAQLKVTEIERCMSAMLPTYADCPKTIRMPQNVGQQICIIPFDVGPARMAMLLLFPEGMIFSENRLRDVGQICAYHLAGFQQSIFGVEVLQDLTEREMECLSWIAEGKTSDEISLIIGISRNTVNNYITGIMRKTSTKTRSEAIAHAVRNNLI